MVSQVTSHPHNAFLTLGSNLSDPRGLLRHAVWGLTRDPAVELISSSHIYETPPWGIADQPSFLNAAIEIRTSLEPDDLLELAQTIEHRLGRVRSGDQWGPRLIDIDIALYGEEIIETEDLIVPHPRLHERAFALIPLLEIAPHLLDPRWREPFSEALKKLPQSEVHGCIAHEPLVLHLPGIPEECQFTSTSLWLSRTSDETEWLAEGLARTLHGGEVIAMIGNLGAGKTCFARGLARGLGIPGPITSPSYVLVKSYEGTRLSLHHADFYRLATAEGSEESPSGSREIQPEPPDLASLGMEDYLEDPNAVILIEWADRFPEWLEPPFHLIEIRVRPDFTRLILVRTIGEEKI